jgi:large subunit ribosomal protein L18
MALTKQGRKQRIKYRIRKKVNGSAEKPRLCVYRSNNHIYAQVIDDVNNKTIIAASSLEKDILEKKDIKKVDQAKLVGKLIAEKAKKSGIIDVVFDRGGYLYHGRVKSLAESAREEGLKF